MINLHKDKRDEFLELKRSISREVKIITEIISIDNSIKNITGSEEKKNALAQLRLLHNSLEKESQKIMNITAKVSLARPLVNEVESKPKSIEDATSIVKKKGKVTGKELKELEKGFGQEEIKLDKGVLKRLKKKEKKIEKKKEKKPSWYLQLANKFFAERAREVIKKELFETMKLDLTRASMNIAPTGYISMILFSTVVVAVFAFLMFIFLLFFKVSVILPFVSLANESILLRALKFVAIIFLLPGATFLFMYFYPSLERRSSENFINRELPFAAIQMAAVSGSLIEPTKIFSIIISTEEYPYLEREFKKLINEINIYGYDLVTALRNAAFRSPSRKLADLYNGLSTNITSGGDLEEFFQKRADSLLLEYRLEREKYSKTTETFMDIYISVVIAAPMILMLLLMMMQISGLGVSLSTSTITLILILVVGVINVFFLTFLKLKQPAE